MVLAPGWNHTSFFDQANHTNPLHRFGGAHLYRDVIGQGGEHVSGNRKRAGGIMNKGRIC
jgi:hypothetical protein